MQPRSKDERKLTSNCKQPGEHNISEATVAPEVFMPDFGCLQQEVFGFTDASDYNELSVCEWPASLSRPTKEIR